MMRIFAAGASGVIGRQLLPLLIKGGHQVVAQTRSMDTAATLRAAGAEPVVADALDAGQLAAGLTAVTAAVVLTQLVASRRFAGLVHRD
jgi:uncharacterized protein YbjT (DUF2867 family)